MGARRPGAFTVEHFRQYASLLVFDDDEQRDPEDWQLEIVKDIFKGYREAWVLIPEGNGKTTFIAQLALYGADYVTSPWIPVGASSTKQARILYDQADGFVTRTPGMQQRFRCYSGYIIIKSKRNGGKGIEIFAHDPRTGDGVIPFPYAIVDELHRHDDLRLYSLWKGKLRKRGAQILTISTAGEPETEFENTRDEIRSKATTRERNGAHLRVEGPGLVMHEWMVDKDDQCDDMDAVKAANPLWAITPATLAEDFASPTLDLNDWKRLKCNRPTRSAQSAISEKEWDDSQVEWGLRPKAPTDLGIDIGWKWDCTALVPLQAIESTDPNWAQWATLGKERYARITAALLERLAANPELAEELAAGKRPTEWKHKRILQLGKGVVLTPPRDGSSLHPDEVKHAALAFASDYQLQAIVIDVSRAEDIASWIEDELGVEVIDRGQGNVHAVEDYDAFMKGLRDATLFHVADNDVRPHVLNAIARLLPGGDRRFDRPSAVRANAKAQDRRVIDGLTAAAMVVQHADKAVPVRSVYEDRYAKTPAA